MSVGRPLRAAPCAPSALSARLCPLVRGGGLLWCGLGWRAVAVRGRVGRAACCIVHPNSDRTRTPGGHPVRRDVAGETISGAPRRELAAPLQRAASSSMLDARVPRRAASRRYVASRGRGHRRPAGARRGAGDRTGADRTTQRTSRRARLLSVVRLFVRNQDSFYTMVTRAPIRRPGRGDDACVRSAPLPLVRHLQGTSARNIHGHGTPRWAMACDLYT